MQHPGHGHCLEDEKAVQHGLSLRQRDTDWSECANDALFLWRSPYPRLVPHVIEANLSLCCSQPCLWPSTSSPLVSREREQFLCSVNLSQTETCLRSGSNNVNYSALIKFSPSPCSSKLHHVCLRMNRAGFRIVSGRFLETSRKQQQLAENVFTLLRYPIG